jgi:hypothetical protein
VVHVLSEVLHKVNRSLRDNGNLLILQPTQENSILQVEIDHLIEFREEMLEPNFQEYLSATMEAIHNVIADGLFEIESESKAPEAESYLCTEYDSVNEWREDRQPFCEDLDEFNEMYERIQTLIDGQKHRIMEFLRDYKVLLRKL